MKCFALGSSTASLVFLIALEGAAQNAAPPPATTETAPPPPAPTATEAPAQPPAVAAPNPTAPNSVAQNPTPTANASPTPAYPYAPPTYPPYRYPNPYGGFGWGMPEEPPKEMAYNGGGIPRGYKLEERYNIGLLIAGPTLFGLGYAIAVFTASENDDDAPLVGGAIETTPWSTLYIPITGPFAFSAYAPRGSAFIYIFEGLAQVCGVGLFLGGILRPKELLVRTNTLEAFQPTLRVGPGAMQVEMHF